MAVLSYYLKNAAAAGSNYGSLQQGTSPSIAAAVTTTGFNPGTLTSTRYALMDFGADIARTATGALGWTAQGATDPLPTTALNNTTGNAWRSENPLTGDFANTSWAVSIAMRPSTATVTGRPRLQLWKGAAADGSDATRLGGVLTPSAGQAQSVTTTTYTYAATLAALGSATSLVNEYLFVQAEFETTAAGSANGSTSRFYLAGTGATAALITPDFVAKHVLNPTNASVGSPAAGTPTLVQVPLVAVLTQDSPRFRSDAAAVDTAATWAAAVSTPWTPSAAQVAGPFRLRFSIANTGNAAAAAASWQLYASHDGGAYAPVTATSFGVRAANAGASADETVIATGQLPAGPGGAGAFVSGLYDETGATGTLALAAGAFTELEFGLALNVDDVAEGDTLDFRVYCNGAPLDTYSNTARLTVPTETKTPAALVRGYQFSSDDADLVGVSINDTVEPDGATAGAWAGQALGGMAAAIGSFFAPALPWVTTGPFSFTPFGYYDETSVVQAGNAVSQWSDLGPNAIHLKQPTGVNQPTWDPATQRLTFNGFGLGQCLVADARDFSAKPALAAFAAIELVSGAVGDDGLLALGHIGGGDTSGAGGRLFWWTNAATQMFMYGTGGVAVTITPDQMLRLATVFDASGTDTIYNDSAGSSSSGEISSGAFSNNGLLVLGSRYYGGAPQNFAPMKIRRLMLLDFAPSAGQRAEINAWLAGS